MGLSSAYGRADDEESKAVLRRAIELGSVSCLSTRGTGILIADALATDFLGYVRIFVNNQLSSANVITNTMSNP